MIATARRRAAIGALGVLASLACGDAATAAVPIGDPWIVVDIADGDTLDVAQGTTMLTVRLIGVNAPESGECFADEATAMLSEIVAAGPVWLAADRSDIDQYGRALRYVLDADGDDVGAQLVEHGAATARSYRPDTANDVRYSLLQIVASDEGRGLWASNACGPGPAHGSAIVPVVEVGVSVTIEIHPDAAGNDNENLNDEWVRFTNAGAAAIDLDGWTVRDESSSHRYRFDDLVLPGGGSVTLYTGCGIDSATERYWCNIGSAVWNNDGDTVFLLDPDGNVVSTTSY